MSVGLAIFWLFFLFLFFFFFLFLFFFVVVLGIGFDVELWKRFCITWRGEGLRGGVVAPLRRRL